MSALEVGVSILVIQLIFNPKAVVKKIAKLQKIFNRVKAGYSATGGK